MQIRVSLLVMDASENTGFDRPHVAFLSLCEQSLAYRSPAGGVALHLIQFPRSIREHVNLTNMEREHMQLRGLYVHTPAHYSADQSFLPPCSPRAEGFSRDEQDEYSAVVELSSA